MRSLGLVLILKGMSDADKPNPIDDLRKGFGLLFRAARTTIEKLPTGEIEEAVLSGAREVGRALENVTHSVEEQFLRRPSAYPQGPPPIDGDKKSTPPEAGNPEPTTDSADSAKPHENDPADKTRIG